jgi:hypothetical protein
MVAVEDAVIVEMVICYADRSATRNTAPYKLTVVLNRREEIDHGKLAEVHVLNLVIYEILWIYDLSPDSRL